MRQRCRPPPHAPPLTRLPRAQACLDYPEPPPTAEGIKTWRKSLKNEPGKIIIHPGLQGDMQPDGRTYGRLNYKDASTTDLMNWEPTSEMLAMMRDKQESIYASTKAEPLGRSMDRGHVLPEHMHGDKFSFGKPGDRGNGGSKEALFPVVRAPGSTFKMFKPPFPHLFPRDEMLMCLSLCARAANGERRGGSGA
jgi:hypothetical protein